MALQTHAVRAWHEEGTPEEDRRYYHHQWQLYRLRRNLAFFFIATWPAACIVLFRVSREWLHLPITALAIMLAWLGTAIGLVFWAQEFRCPRCRRRFAALGSRRGGLTVLRGLFDPICGNCKLRKFEYDKGLGRGL